MPGLAGWPGASVDADGGRWVAAGYLRAGDRLPRRSGEQATLTDVSVAPGRLHVYNLNVAEEHTYAVGKDSVLVHNQCPPNGAGQGTPLTRSQARDLAKYQGFRETGQYSFYSHGQPVFTNGRVFYTPDVDAHRGGVWKVFDSRGNRIGTVNVDLNLLGD